MNTYQQSGNISKCSYFEKKLGTRVSFCYYLDDDGNKSRKSKAQFLCLAREFSIDIDIKKIKDGHFSMSAEFYVKFDIVT